MEPRAKGRAPRRIVATLGAVVFLASMGLASQLAAGPIAGCGVAVEGDITESSAFTPTEARLSQSNERLIEPDAAAPIVSLSIQIIPPASLNRLQLTKEWQGPDGELVQIYTKGSLTKAATLPTLLADGAVYAERYSRGQGESFAETIRTMFPGRVAVIEIGPYSGSLVWADPKPDGLRPHHLRWADEHYDYRLIADMSAADIVNLGRSIVCSP